MAKETLPFDVTNVASLARPRYGDGNPEVMSNRFWEYMVRQRRNAWWARKTFSISRATCGPADRDSPDGPVWCFTRFGRTVSVMPFDTIYVGGEHEDYYDPDFCIYNDIVVEDANGGFTIYGYPKELFPPTDFHTATVVGNMIWLIGSLGYRHMREEGSTQVLRLDTRDYRIERLETSGECPGWISRHAADFDVLNDEIVVRGGKVWTDGRLTDNRRVYALSLQSLEWRDLGDMPRNNDP